MATENLQLYRCDICGNLVQIILGGGPLMHCCGQEMNLIPANTNDEADTEKHVPVFTKVEPAGNEVRVGRVMHPMVDEHYIMFMELISEDKNHVYLQYLHPGEEAKMILERNLGKTLAKAFCNLHGLWEGESD